MKACQAPGILLVQKRVVVAIVNTGMINTGVSVASVE